MGHIWSSSRSSSTGHQSDDVDSGTTSTTSTTTRTCLGRWCPQLNSDMLPIADASFSIASGRVHAVAPVHSTLFASHGNSTCSTVLYGRYRHEMDGWYVCRIRSRDCNDTYTIVWEDGTLQIGTRRNSELKRPHRTHVAMVEQQVQAATVASTAVTTAVAVASTASVASKSQLAAEFSLSNQVAVITHNELDVWEAAKKGDMATVLHLIDVLGVSPNAVELLDQTTPVTAMSVNDAVVRVVAQGRTPLYWACFIGHVELVRELLTRGAVDYDGSALLCITSNARADDNRDLMFDPDTETYSDWVDYEYSTNANGKQQQPTGPVTGSSTGSTIATDDAALIRAMLLTAAKVATGASQPLHEQRYPRRRAAAPQSQWERGQALRDMLPTRLYQSSSCYNTTVPPSCYNTTVPPQTSTGRALDDLTSFEDDDALSSRTLNANPEVNSVNSVEAAAEAPTISNSQLGVQASSLPNNHNECVVCFTVPPHNQGYAIPVPCGHLACCHACLLKIQKRRDGCPICRGRILAIL